MIKCFNILLYLYTFIFISLYHPALLEPPHQVQVGKKMIQHCLEFMVFVGAALLFLPSHILTFIINENTILTFTTHQIHLTKNSTHTSDSMGHARLISAHDEKTWPGFGSDVLFSITINIAQALLPVFLTSFFFLHISF